jgi:peroxiredoxin
MTLQSQLHAMHLRILEDAPNEGAAFDADTDQLVQAGIGSAAPKIGDLAPDFRLPDQLGREVDSRALRTEGPLVISFYRGNWCPYCNLEMRALQQSLPQIEEAGAGLVAISPQLPDESLSMAEKHELAFPVLSDVGNRIGRQYGLLFTVSEKLRPMYAGFGIDLSKSNGDESFELPVPGTFVLDTDGIVRDAFVDPDYKKRVEPEQIVKALAGLTGS